MADLSKAQRKRAEARQRRRGQAEEDPQPQPESAPSDGQDAHHGVLQAAKVAAAAGAAGAAVAAARALTSHDDDEAPTTEAEPSEQPEQEEPELQATDEPQPTDEPEPQASEEPESEQREDAPPVAGAAQRDARRALERGREQLEDLLGRPVEQVSSLERTHDGWVLALEVVELRRVPETTDVLASYELELDDDLNLRRYQQVRRYHRGRTDNGDGN